MKPLNYLNNKDLLKEIHKSKISYCSFTDPKYSDYDIIVSDVSEIIENIENAKINRAKASIRQLNTTLPSNVKINEEDIEKEVAGIPTTDLVFRVMTWDHIPMRETETKVSKAEVAKTTDFSALFDEEDGDQSEADEDYEVEYDLVVPLLAAPGKKARVNFPPFVHYVLDENNTPVLVGKSHWKGDLESGEFCITHGMMTRNFANMILKLCQRYASRSNWRGYTYNDEMVSQALLQLSYVGLQFNEAKSPNPFAYLTAIAHNSFSRVLNVEKKHQSLRDDILEINGMNPSYTRMNSGTTKYEE